MQLFVCVYRNDVSFSSCVDLAQYRHRALTHIHSYLYQGLSVCCRDAAYVQGVEVQLWGVLHVRSAARCCREFGVRVSDV